MTGWVRKLCFLYRIPSQYITGLNSHTYVYQKPTLRYKDWRSERSNELGIQLSPFLFLATGLDKWGLSKEE